MSKSAVVVGLLLLGLGLPAGVLAGPAVTPLVSTNWVEEQLGADGLVLLDIRDRATFDAGRIPGALSTPYPGGWRATRDGVSWLIPEVVDLEAYLASLGIDDDTSVVVVPAGADSTELGGATWVYWLLQYLGHDAVAILDGGWNAWAGEGRTRTIGHFADHPEPATFTAEPRPEIFIDTPDVAANAANAILVDARPHAEFVGEAVSPLVARPGHIPGAINLPNALFYDAEAGRLRPAGELAAALPSDLMDRSRPIVSYCNTGHWSSINWFVLHELLGFTDVRLYPGSMAAWTRDPALPVTVGDEAGG